MIRLLPLLAALLASHAFAFEGTLVSESNVFGTKYRTTVELGPNGRMREEVVPLSLPKGLDPTKVTRVTVYRDATKGSVGLDLERKVATEFPHHEPSPSMKAMLADKTPWQAKTLGEAEVAGLPCTRVELTGGKRRIELCLSKDVVDGHAYLERQAHGLTHEAYAVATATGAGPLVLRSTQPSGGVEVTVLQLTAAKHPPERFEVPEGFATKAAGLSTEDKARLIKTLETK